MLVYRVDTLLFVSPLKWSNFCSVSALKEPPGGGGQKEHGVKQEVTKEACSQHKAENTWGLCIIHVRCCKIEELSKF